MRFSRALFPFLALCAVLRAEDAVPPDLMKVAMDAEPRVAEFLRVIGVPMQPDRPVMDPVGLMDSFEARRKAWRDVLKARGLEADGPDDKWRRLAARFLSEDGGAARAFSGDEVDLRAFARALLHGPFSNALRESFGGDGVLSFQPSFDVRRYTTVEDYMNHARRTSLRLARGGETVFLEPSPAKGVFVLHVLDRPGQDRAKTAILHAVVRETARGTLAALHQDWDGAASQPEYTEALIDAFLELSLRGESIRPFAAAVVLRRLDGLQDNPSKWWAELIVNRLAVAADAVQDPDRRFTLHRVIYSLDHVSGDVGGILLGVANLTMDGFLDRDVRSRQPVSLVLDADLIPRRREEVDALVRSLSALKDVSWVVVGEEKAVRALQKTFSRVPSRRCAVVPGLFTKVGGRRAGGRRLDLGEASAYLSGRSPRIFTLAGTEVTGLEEANPVYLKENETLEDGINFLVKTGDVERTR